MRYAPGQSHNLSSLGQGVLRLAMVLWAMLLSPAGAVAASPGVRKAAIIHRAPIRRDGHQGKRVVPASIDGEPLERTR